MIPSQQKTRPGSGVCSRCINGSAAGKAARAKWVVKWRKTYPDKAKALDARRLWLGGHSIGYAKTAEQTQVIRAHIKARIAAYKQEQRRS